MNAPASNPAAAQAAVPLNDTEIDRLDTFLAGLPPGAMTVEMIDGFYSALHCSPDRVGPAVWLPLIWGEQAEASADFKDEGEAREIVGLLMRHWDVVATDLERARAARDVRLPLLMQDEVQGIALANDWATGFVRGMQVAPEGWQTILEDEERGAALVPMMMLHHEHDTDPDMRPPPISPQDRQELLGHLVAGLAQVYDDFAFARREALQAERQALTFRRTGAKPGRNDPCPCGSGRKFKLCCAQA